MDFVNRFVPSNVPSRYTLESIDSHSLPLSITNNNRLNIVIFEKGCGSCTINDTHLTLVSPMVLCINEAEQFEITRGNNLQGKVLSFHPEILNPYFDFDTIRTFDHTFSPDDIEMALKLSIFFNRNENYMGQIKASEPALKQLQKYLLLLENNNPLNSIPPSHSSKAGHYFFIDTYLRS